MKLLVILITVTSLVSCVSVNGILESEFKLAQESRLPVWFSPLSDDTKREELTVNLRFYTPIFGGNDAVLVLKKGIFPLKRVSGKSEFHAKHRTWARENWPERARPAFTYITVDGVTELVEFKKKGPIFYISTESSVKEVMGQHY